MNLYNNFQTVNSCQNFILNCPEVCKHFVSVLGQYTTHILLHYLGSFFFFPPGVGGWNLNLKGKGIHALQGDFALTPG